MMDRQHEVGALQDLPDVLIVEDVARVLRCGRNAIYELVASGSLRSAKIGRSIRIPKTALIEFLDNGSDPTVTDEAAFTAAPNVEERGRHLE